MTTLLQNKPLVQELLRTGLLTSIVNNLPSKDLSVVYVSLCFLGELSKEYATRPMVIDTDAISHLVRLLSMDYHPALISEAARCLGFIGEDDRFRELVLQSGCCDKLMSLVLQKVQVNHLYLANIHTNTKCFIIIVILYIYVHVIAMCSFVYNLLIITHDFV